MAETGKHEEETLEIAVVIPCYNEAATVADVVRDFRAVLPTARVVVFDNNSTDATVERARAAGAEVIAVERQGKGRVVAAMFAELEADVFVMADGDGTYDAADAPRMVRLLLERRLDMVTGARAGVTDDAGRPGHALGNQIFNWLYRRMFASGYSDIFSGYRVFSRRFVKSFPALSTGFEIETELSVHAQILRLPMTEIPVGYGRRPEGSTSKLSTFRDGFRILSIFVLLMKEVRPFAFFNYATLLTLIASVSFMYPVLRDYFETGLVDRVPTWILAIALLVIAFLLFSCGVILDSVARGRLEQKRLRSLSIPRATPGQAAIERLFSPAAAVETEMAAQPTPIGAARR